MLHALQPAPFPDADRQRQYEAVRAALAATPGLPTTLLLGNLPALAGLEVDALLLQANCLLLLVLTPGAGCLSLPAQPLGPWQLSGQALPARAGAPNPLAYYHSHLPAAQAWVAAQLGRAVAELPPGLGVAVFDTPLTFSPEVEERLHQAAATDEFELLGGAERLPARLRTLAATAVLAEEELLDWAADLQLATADELPTHRADDTPAAYVQHKLRQLWQWLGAADVPPDPPYGAPSYPTPAEFNHQEEGRLQQLRQELQAELRQQRQEAATREATYQQELLRLQQQVLQAGSVAGVQQAQAAEAARSAAQTELEARTQELDRRIQQLGQLIGQLRAAPAAPTAAPTQSAGVPRPPAARPAPGSVSTRAPRRSSPVRQQPVDAWLQLRPAERWVVLGVALTAASLGAWKLSHSGLSAPAKPHLAAASRRAAPSLLSAEAEAATPPPVYVVDSSLAPAAAVRFDTLGTTDNHLLHEPAELSPSGQHPQLKLDTQQVAPASAPVPADSAAPGAGPTP